MISHSAARKAGFEIIEPAPAGGSARVYKSWHIPSGELCALKVPAENVNADYLQREADLLGLLNHPSIVRPLRCGSINSTVYLATHWVDGVRLAENLRQGAPVSEERAVRLFSQIASALQHAHQRGVVHADLSPANILVDGNDKVTLVDFGIGQQIDVATVTASSDLTGTLRYVAPEVIKSEKASAASDQYSLAVILYELLSGCWPYEGEATAAAALHSHLYAEPVSLQERNPSVSSVMDNVLSMALHKDPGARFKDIAAMYRALNDREPDTGRPCVRLTRPMSVGGEKSALAGSFVKVSAFFGALVILAILLQGEKDSTRTFNEVEIFSESHANEINDNCNLLSVPVLNNANNVENFYGSNDQPENITLTSFVPDQWMLEIGKSNVYGLYGQIIKVEPDSQYQLSAMVQRNGYVHMPALRIEWLDANYQVLPELLMTYGIKELEDGFIKMPAVEVPDNAAYAVPTVYKDETAGTMTVSAMVFRDTSCLQH